MSSASKGPWHLWVVGIVGLLWSLMGAVNYLMTETRNESYMSKFTPEQLDYFYSYPAWAVATWAIAVWGGVVGCLLLLMRKCAAYAVLLVSFCFMIVTTIYSYGLTDGYEIMGGVGPMLFSVVIFLLSLALVIYSRAMCKRGVLA